jgi:hypothetical protein
MQNQLLARWLAMSNILLVVLGIAFTAVVQYDTTSDEPMIENWVKSFLIALLVLDVVISIGTASFVLFRECAARSIELDLSDVLSAAVKPIDDPLYERLVDGTVRLLCSAWLTSFGTNRLVLPCSAVVRSCQKRRLCLAQRQRQCSREATAPFSRSATCVNGVLTRRRNGWHILTSKGGFPTYLE